MLLTPPGPPPPAAALRSADSLIRSITRRYHSHDAALVLNDILLPPMVKQTLHCANSAREPWNTYAVDVCATRGLTTRTRVIRLSHWKSEEVREKVQGRRQGRAKRCESETLARIWNFILLTGYVVDRVLNEMFELVVVLANECCHTRDIINILKKSNATIEAAKIKIIPDFCSNCKSKFPTFARIKTQKLPFS